MSVKAESFSAQDSPLRVARSTRTWDSGETTEHFWIEVEPDAWQEVTPRPETLDDVNDYRERFHERERSGGTMYLRAATRYIKQFGDSFELLFSSK